MRGSRYDQLIGLSAISLYKHDALAKLNLETKGIWSSVTLL
jgi:hypothetical protein